jgi:hypothetical protein
MANNREISQFAGLVTVNDSTNQVSIGASFQLTGGGHIGIGSDVTDNYIDATGPIKGTRFLAGDTPQGSAGLSLRAHGGGTNYGLLTGEGNTIAFAGARGNDGLVGSMAFIKNVAEGDLGASWPNALTFGVRRFGSEYEALRITSEGYLRLSTNGIQFNGDTAAANALDDYEEGTWDPTWTGNGASIGSGTYTKVGRLVTLFASITFPTTANTATQVLGGLPFNASAVQNFAGYSNTASNATYPGFTFRYSATQYYTVRSASAQQTDLTRAQTSGIAANICIQYTVA